MLAPGYVPKLRTYADNYILPALGGMDVRHVRSSHVKALARDMPSMSRRGNRLSPKYIRNVLDALRGFMRWLRHEERLIEDVPRFPSIDVPEHDFKVMTPVDQWGVFDRVPREHRRIFMFLFAQGCRPSEARALKWDSVGDGVVTYRRTFSGRRLVERTKTGRVRRNYLFPEGARAIRRRVNLPEGEAGRLARIRRLDEFVFTHGGAGKPYSADLLNRVYSDALAAYNADMARENPRWRPLDVTLYEATKHSFGTALYAAGATLEALQRHFGHSKPEMTMRYARVDAVELFRKLDDARRRAGSS
jgi:integrase